MVHRGLNCRPALPRHDVQDGVPDFSVPDGFPAGSGCVFRAWQRGPGAGRGLVAIAAFDNPAAFCARTGRTRCAAASRGNTPRRDADARAHDHTDAFAFAISFARSGHACTARVTACR